MPPPESPATHRTYFPALDGLRALALGMVFLAHYGNVGLFGVGVNVFFVLSGFLITGILWDSREKPFRIRTFYMRRTLRIFPLYWGLFFFLWLTTPLLHWQWNRYWLAWPAYAGNYLLYMPRLLPRGTWELVTLGRLTSSGNVLFMGHFWSLCVEEQFYLFWPWVVFHMPRRALLWTCGLVILVLPLARVAAPHFLSAQALYGNIMFRTLPFQLDAFLLGAWLALLLRGGSRAFLLRQACWAADLAFLAAVAFVYCRVDLHLRFLHQPFTHAFGLLTWQFSVVNMFSAALILGALQPASWTHRVLHLQPARWLGQISYGAYIFHDLFHLKYARLAYALWPGNPHLKGMTLFIAAIGTILLASLSFRYFEQPILRRKDRLAPVN